MIKRIVRRIIRVQPTTLLRAASVLTLVALGMMVWSMLDPTPMPVMLAMSIAQMFGTLAFSMYGLAVYKDLRRIRRERRESSQQIPIRETIGEKLGEKIVETKT
jgi:hypothetical protein